MPVKTQRQTTEHDRANTESVHGLVTHQSARNHTRHECDETQTRQTGRRAEIARQAQRGPFGGHDLDHQCEPAHRHQQNNQAHTQSTRTAGRAVDIFDDVIVIEQRPAGDDDRDEEHDGSHRQMDRQRNAGRSQEAGGETAEQRPDAPHPVNPVDHRFRAGGVHLGGLDVHPEVGESVGQRQGEQDRPEHPRRRRQTDDRDNGDQKQSGSHGDRTGTESVDHVTGRHTGQGAGDPGGGEEQTEALQREPGSGLHFGQTGDPAGIDRSVDEEHEADGEQHPVVVGSYGRHSPRRVRPSDHRASLVDAAEVATRRRFRTPALGSNTDVSPQRRPVSTLTRMGDDTRTDPSPGDDHRRWRADFDAAAKRDVPFETMSGIPLEPVYGDGPYPGQFPYTRGIHPGMYRGRLWTMRMFAGFGTAEDTNARFKDILRNGGGGLSTAFDMPTLMGHDSDSEWAEGEVGRAGVAIDTLADMEDLFAGIDLGNVSTSMTINGPANIALAHYVAVAEKGGVDRNRLSGTIQNDILKEYQAQKEYIYPPRPSMRIVTDMIRFTTAEMPRWHPVSISGYHITRGGQHRRTGTGVHDRQRIRVRGGRCGGWTRHRPSSPSASASSSTATATSSRSWASSEPPAASGLAG